MNVLWTNTDINKAGYPVAPLCPLCGIEADSIIHRAWWCTADKAKEKRDELPHKLVARAKADNDKGKCDHMWDKAVDYNFPEAANLDYQEIADM